MHWGGALARDKALAQVVPVATGTMASWYRWPEPVGAIGVSIKAPTGEPVGAKSSQPYLVGGLEHEFYFSIYWE